MQTVIDEHVRVAAAVARNAGHVDVMHMQHLGNLRICRVVGIKLACDLREVAAALMAEARYAPIGYRYDDHALRLAASEFDRAIEQGAKLVAIILQVAAAILIVDA